MGNSSKQARRNAIAAASKAADQAQLEAKVGEQPALEAEIIQELPPAGEQMQALPEAAQAELKAGLAPEGPALALKLTEVNPEAGLTPEQLAVAASLSPSISPTSAEAKKERHPDRLKASEQRGSVKAVIAYVIARKAQEPGVARKQLISELVDGKAGFKIAFYTARTQVQVALAGMKPSVIPAPVAQAS